MADEEVDLSYYDNLENENKQLRNKITEREAQISNTSFTNRDDDNLIQWQIDTSDILDMIEHFLKGDIQKTDKETGDVYFVQPKEEDLILLNSYGVNSIMHLLGNYINRNTTLSFYDGDRINEILGDLGDELNKFIFCNYEKMGLDTEFKRSKYELIVLSILHSVESSYRKALGGKTLEEVNRNVNVIQSESVGGGRIISTQKRKRSLLHPFG